MNALRVIADDLTGACDVGAELLPWPGGVLVHSQPSAAGMPADALCVRNTQSRTLTAAEAGRRVAAALGDVRQGWAGIVLKKIDTGLRGQLGAEIDGAMDRLGIEEAFVLPAIPEVGRTTEQGRQMIAGIPVHETAFARDPQNPIHDASVAAAIEATSRRRAGLVGLEAVRDATRFATAIDGARAAGAAVIVCDSETDADLERAVRALLRRCRPLLLVGSTGLARALRRVLGSEHGGRVRAAAPAAVTDAGVFAVIGSAHPATRLQIDRAIARRLIEPLVVVPNGGAEAAGPAAARLLRAGVAAALVPPADVLAGRSAELLAALRGAALTGLARARPNGIVLVGGETAYEVLDGLGHPPLWLEARLAPLVVRSRLTAGVYAGLPVITKGGSTGAPDLLGQIVRQLGRGSR